MDISSRILYEDNHLIVVNKPAGILVQGDETGDQTLSDFVKQYLKKKYEKPGAVFLGVVHRIDRPVSGVVVFARTSKALSRMNERFRTREVQKSYLAIAEGQPAEPSATLVHWLRKNESSNKVTAFKRETADAQRCELSYRKIHTPGKFTLLEVKPVTGRSHQIRAQLSAIGCPIYGDLKYGSEHAMEDQSICLHAHRLAFIHPVTLESVEYTAPVPANQIWQRNTAGVN
jgi:23S rRNA pseudouridine1911/1915/1917 synthase